mgnify:FL=1|jgi:heme-degrading monooxygenase HmoA
MNNSYYAVIFSSQKAIDDDGYEIMAEKMVKLAEKQKGFIGIESVRGSDGKGITISYWQTLEDIKQWKINTEHLLAQKLGKTKWYDSYTTRICKVEREYTHPADNK